MFGDIDLLTKLAMVKYDIMKKDPLRFFMRSIMAGAYLGVAAILSYTLGALLSHFPVASKIAVAASFGIGLVAIVYLGAELFTGNCFFTMIPIFKKELKVKDVVPMWIVSYVGNIIGISILCFLFVKGGSQSAVLSDYLKPLIETKLSVSMGELFIRAVLCNFVVCIAAYAGVKVKDETARLCLIMFMVMAFVLPGFEHCIANAGVFTLGYAQLGTTINWGALPLHMLISTLGNMVGGCLMFAGPIYYIFRAPKK